MTKSYDKWDAGKTLTWKLFNWSWEVEAPAIHLNDTQRTRLRGSFSSFDPEINEVMKNEMRVVNITIPKLAEMVYDQIQVRVMKRDHIPIMYEMIVDHLGNWYNEITYAVAVVDPPIEDLRKLDLLASHLYPIVADIMGYNKPQNVTHFSGLEQFARKRPSLTMNGVNPNDPKKKMNIVDVPLLGGVPASPDVAEPAPKRNNIIDSLVNTAYARTQLWPSKKP